LHCKLSGKPESSTLQAFQLLQIRVVRGKPLIIESVRIVVTPAKREQLQRALAAWAGPTEVEPGCLNCRILQDDGDSKALCYEAQWKSREDLLRHVRSEQYKRLLQLMDLGSEPPSLSFTPLPKPKVWI